MIASRNLRSSSSVPTLPLRHRSQQQRRLEAQRVRAAAFAESSTVKVVVQGRHLPVTPALKQYAEEKVQKAIHNFEGGIKQASAPGNKGCAHLHASPPPSTSKPQRPQLQTRLTPLC